MQDDREDFQALMGLQIATIPAVWNKSLAIVVSCYGQLDGGFTSLFSPSAQKFPTSEALSRQTFHSEVSHLWGLRAFPDLQPLMDQSKCQ
ncbi:hypothetical protein [Phormidesmis sp. 146-33]